MTEDNKIIVEVKPMGRFWQVTTNGQMLVSAVTREQAVAQAGVELGLRDMLEPYASSV